MVFLRENIISLLAALLLCSIISTPSLVLAQEQQTQTQEQSQSTTETQTQTQTQTQTEKEPCPSYGCMMRPPDIMYEETAAIVENIMNENPKAKYATLTLVGYKGGAMKDQINQDRAFVLPSFTYADTEKYPESNLLMGVFDGHGKLGERVSEYSVSNLPELLSDKLSNLDYSGDKDDSFDKEVGTALTESFVYLDKTIPTKRTGGCTASVILQLQHKIYIANAGDSVSFLALHHYATNQTYVLYETREDKPHLPDERARVESMGGYVYIPPPNKPHSSSRVVTIDAQGRQSGLAMSRSIGDWDAGDVGVIPDPIVDVFVLEDLLNFDVYSFEAKENDNNNDDDDDDDDDEKKVEEEECVIQADGSQSCTPKEDKKANSNYSSSSNNEEKGNIDHEKDFLFAVSATDGMMDYLTPQEIANVLAVSLRDEDDKDNNADTNSNEEEEEQDPQKHLLKACEELVIEAAIGWTQENGGRYRDDIAISVSRIQMPSSP